MKIYRFVARNSRQRKMHGIFRGLDFEAAHIPDGEYEEVMAPINSALHCPTHNEIHQKNIEFWFTETGYQKFRVQIHKLLELYQKYAPNYIKEWDVLEQEIELMDPNIKYKDVYQIALRASS